MTQNDEYTKFVADTFDELKDLFLKKSQQYGDIDPLGNFRLGAALSFGDSSPEAMYETLKGYLNKHVVHVYGHAVNGSKVDESWKDIAVYAVIALFLRELYYKEEMVKLDAKYERDQSKEGPAKSEKD